ncbi:MAG: hypothetical protein RLO81_05455 [Fulvivirga sp.]|uniref:hypothetical protein n=1 Tax=Fulvivirga sp. TaxID=1931237 RepID=UPI0032F048A6
MVTEKNSISAIRVRIALLNLFLLACLGTLIRYHFYEPIEGVNLTYLHHAHSHLAFLGWVFMALFVLVTHQFLQKNRFFDKSYTYLFFALQGANFGMLFTFPFTGYAPWSIAFSTLHTICAIIFTFIFISDLKKEYTGMMWPMSARFVIWALIFMLISNLAPFALGPVVSMFGKTDAYYFLVNSYLHFQYNGWFTFALLGLVIRFLETKDINTNHPFIKRGLVLKAVAIFPALSISILSEDENELWFYLALLASIIQLLGLCYLLIFFWGNRSHLAFKTQKWVGYIALFAFSALLLQHILHVLGALPAAVDLLINRQLVVAYLHLVFIGFVTFLIFHQLITLGILNSGTYMFLGMALLLIAFIASELLLLTRNFVSHSNLLLFILALLHLIGILTIFSQHKHRFLPKDDNIPKQSNIIKTIAQTHQKTQVK